MAYIFWQLHKASYILWVLTLIFIQFRNAYNNYSDTYNFQISSYTSSSKTQNFTGNNIFHGKYHYLTFL